MIALHLGQPYELISYSLSLWLHSGHITLNTLTCFMRNDILNDIIHLSFVSNPLGTECISSPAKNIMSPSFGTIVFTLSLLPITNGADPVSYTHLRAHET